MRDPATSAQTMDWENFSGYFFPTSAFLTASSSL